MSYKRVVPKKRRRAMSGLGAVLQELGLGAWSDLPAQSPSGGCGADQRYDASINAFGAQGQCVNQDQYNAAHAGSAGTGITVSSGPSFLDSLLQGLSTSIGRPGGSSTPVVVQSGGISTGTALAIGGAGLLAVILLTRK